MGDDPGNQGGGVSTLSALSHIQRHPQKHNKGPRRNYGGGAKTPREEGKPRELTETEEIEAAAELWTLPPPKSQPVSTLVDVSSPQRKKGHRRSERRVDEGTESEEVSIQRTRSHRKNRKAIDTAKTLDATPRASIINKRREHRAPSPPSASESDLGPSSIRPSPPSTADPSDLLSADNSEAEPMAPPPKRTPSPDCHQTSQPQPSINSVPTLPPKQRSLSTGLTQKRGYTNQHVNGIAVDRARHWSSPIIPEATLQGDSETRTPRKLGQPAASAPPDKGRGDSSAYLEQWAARATPHAPPPEQNSLHVATDVGSVGLPSRPSSVPPHRRPVVVNYTGGTEDMPPMPVLPPEDQAVTSPQDNPSDLEDEYGHVSHQSDRLASQPYPETRTSGAFPRDYSTAPHTSIVSQHPPRTFFSVPQQIDKGVWGWWKREPHPKYSLVFATRRLFVSTAYHMRSDAMKTMLCDHFSRYGPVRCVLTWEKHAHDNDKAWVVFHREDAVRKVFDDPSSRQATFRSTSRSSTSQVELTIRQPPATSQTRSIWVKFTGRRADARSRSASPRGSARDDGGWEQEKYDTRTLPPTVRVYVLSETLPDGREVFILFFKFPSEGSQPQPLPEVNTGAGEPIFIKEINLGRRCQEKEVIESLSDIFCGEVFNISPPSEQTNYGWVVTGGNPWEMDQFQRQLYRIPGISARTAKVHEWKHIKEPDGLILDAEEAPLIDNRVPAPSENRTSANGSLTVASDSAVDNGEPVLSQQSEHQSDYQSLPSSRQPQSPAFPKLTRQLVSTYQGRQLREEIVDGTIRYVDEAAIFVGRLAKGRETELSLLRRFERYGRIVSIKMNLVASHASYATARVLFQDSRAAASAIAGEDGSPSFGSAIKVELRKVLAHDVQAREMLIDEQGRAISPSMEGQYANLDPPAQALPPAAVPYLLPVTGYVQQLQNPGWPQPQLVFPGGLPQQPMMPGGGMMPFCIGFCPPGVGMEQGQQQTQVPQPQAQRMHSPPHLPQQSGQTPPPPSNPAGLDSVSTAPVPVAVPASVAPSPASAGTSAAPTLLSVKHDAPQLAPDVPPESQPEPLFCPTQPPVDRSKSRSLNPSTTSSVLRPRVLSTKFEDGMLKPIYDPEELKLWREANGIEEVPPPPADVEVLPLLPLSTGGHDPTRNSQYGSPPLSGRSEHAFPSIDSDAEPRSHNPTPQDIPSTDEDTKVVLPRSEPHTKLQTHSRGPNDLCFTCGEHGHLSRDCPERGGSICYSCGEKGHLSRDCAQNRIVLNIPSGRSLAPSRNRERGEAGLPPWPTFLPTQPLGDGDVTSGW